MNGFYGSKESFEIRSTDEILNSLTILCGYEYQLLRFNSYVCKRKNKRQHKCLILSIIYLYFSKTLFII